MQPNPTSKTAPQPTKQAYGQLRVLVVEDTPTVAAIILNGLHQAGMRTALAQSGSQALQQHALFKPDIVLLDLGLPDIDGLELMRRIVAQGHCGLIVITGDDGLATQVVGLDTGADDYIIKPIRVRELAARIRALHRRLHLRSEPRPDVIMINHMRSYMLGSTGTRSQLTPAELAALQMLLDAQGGKVSRDQLSKGALNRSIGTDDRSVDQLILKLRRKLTEQGASPATILSVRGEGYVLSNPSLFRFGPALVANTQSGDSEETSPVAIR